MTGLVFEKTPFIMMNLNWSHLTHPRIRSGLAVRSWTDHSQWTNHSQNSVNLEEHTFKWMKKRNKCWMWPVETLQWMIWSTYVNFVLVCNSHPLSKAIKQGIPGGSGYEPSSSNVCGVRLGKWFRIFSQNLLPFDIATKHEVISAPCMVGTFVAVGGDCPAKFRALNDSDAVF